MREKLAQKKSKKEEKTKNRRNRFGNCSPSHNRLAVLRRVCYNWIFTKTWGCAPGAHKTFYQFPK
jgi:hypothetical protein